MAVDAVHRPPFRSFGGRFVRLVEPGRAFGEIGEFHLVHLLARRIGTVADLVTGVDVPVDAVRLSGLLAAHLDHQCSLELGIRLVVGEVRTDLEPVAEELGRPVALLTCACCGSQRVDRRRNRSRVQVEGHRDQLPGAGDLRLDEPFGSGPDVAARAADPCVWRALERGVFRLHDLVTGHAAELVGIHVVHGLVGEAGGECQGRDGERHETEQHAAGAFHIEIEDRQLADVLALRGEFRVAPLAPPDAEGHQQHAREEGHRQEDEGQDADVGPALESEALHDE